MTFSEFTSRLSPAQITAYLRVQIHKRPYVYGIPYWVAALLVGTTAVLYSGVFSSVISISQYIATHHPYIMLALGPSSFVIGYWFVEKFAPSAGGTGVPSVVKAINLESGFHNIDVDNLVGPKVFAIVILSSLFCILGGGGMGREGPMVQMAACIFYFIGKNFKVIWPYEEHRSWLIAGGAAGIAAAFNTPLAGVVFVLEELAQQHFHQFKNVIITAVIMAGMISQWLSGRYLFLGYPKILQVSFNSLPPVILLSIVIGLIAGLFLKSVSVLSPRAARLRTTHRYAVPALTGLAVAAIAVYVTPVSIGGGVALIDDILFTNPHAASWLVLAARFFSTLLGHLSGCAGGFLAPALSLGAVTGSVFAWLTSPENHNLLVLCGMAGFLSAVTRAPFTALVVVMEMTDRHSAIFPLMIASLISFASTRFITRTEH